MTSTASSVSNPFAALNPAASTTQSTSNTPSNQLDQNSFLQLMTAQFQNQDPTQPQDPTQMLTQLAQFSTVNGIQGMQSSLSTLTNSLMSSQLLSGSSLVGRQVLAPANSVATATAGQTVSGAVNVPTGATSLTIAVTDASGQLVRQMTVPVQAGMTNFTWDGLQNDGTAAAAGNYNFIAVGNVNGQNQSLQTLLAGHVNSITIDPTSQSLTLNTDTMGAVALSSVQQVM